MRNSFTNERYNLTTEDLDTNLIENLQIKLNSENVIKMKYFEIWFYSDFYGNPHFYTNFQYSEIKENQIFEDTYKKLYLMVEN